MNAYARSFLYNINKTFFYEQHSVKNFPSRCIDFQLSHYIVRINVSWFGKHDPFFNFHDANFPNKSKNHDTIVQSSFLFLNRETFFLLLLKTILICQGVDKSRTCVRYVLEIKKFYKLPYFVHEQNFSVSWVLKQS